MPSEPAPCPACADLRARMDRVLRVLALAGGLHQHPGVMMLPEDDWRRAMDALAPPVEGAAPPPGGVG
jgi:hypothetical protein